MLLTILLILSIAAIISCLVVYNLTHKNVCIGCLLISAVIFLGSLFGGIFYTNSCERTEEYVSKSIPLVALRDNRDVKGQFFIGSGNIQENNYYYYAYYDDGDIVTDKVPASNSRIREVSDKEPCLEVHNYRVPLKKQESLAFKLFYLGFISDENGGGIFDGILNSKEFYRFVVPKGTVLQNYEVDLSWFWKGHYYVNVHIRYDSRCFAGNVFYGSVICK